MNLYLVTVSKTDPKTNQTESTVYAIPAHTPAKAIMYSERYGTFVSISETCQEMGADWK